MTSIAIALVVAHLAGAPATSRISCDLHSPGGINGQTLTSANTDPQIRLTPLVCSYLKRSRTSPFLFGIGVHLVVHESQHAQGIADEYQAESRAQRLMPSVLRKILRRLGDYHQSSFRDALQGSQGWHDCLPWNYRHP